MLFSPPSGTIPLEEDEVVESSASSPSPKQQQQQSNSGSSTPRSGRTTKSAGPLKILVRAFNACRRVRHMRSKESVLPPSPLAASPATPTMSVHEAAAIRRLLAVPSRHSLEFASHWSNSSTTSLAVPSDPSTALSPSVSSRSSSSTYYTAASFAESPYSSLRRSHTAQAQHPYALAAPVYE
ncbi:hypothetical protein FRC01_006017 [Tulasnella sp. 417]|nr:hypothetical protein FRC01_006017 [Tulasnella sp. 417]